MIVRRTLCSAVVALGVVAAAGAGASAAEHAATDPTSTRGAAGAAAGRAKDAATDATWARGAAELRTRLEAARDEREARNLLIFIGDGHGVASTTATRIFAGQQAGGRGEDYSVAWDRMPATALIRTYNTDAQVPDSAGTATAILSGIKTRAGVIGVDSGLQRGDCAAVDGHRVPNLFEIARDSGWARGIVTTTRVTHATPAAAYAASADRNFESDTALPADCDQPDIASQLIDARLDVALGGGAAVFRPRSADAAPAKRDSNEARMAAVRARSSGDGRSAQGARGDGRDLLAEFRAAGGRVLLDADEFRAWAGDRKATPDADSIDTPAAHSTAPVLGLFSASHMSFEADRTEDEPSLREMTLAAVDALERSGQRWILLVEAGRIDHAHHATNPTRALVDGVAFSDAIDAARAAVPDDTLILVTADHDHTLSIQGYPRRGSPITGLCEKIGGDGAYCLDQRGEPYPTLSYANGPRTPDTPQEAIAPVGDKNHILETLLPHPMETHGGTDVAAYAAGPRSHLVGGTLEQNTLFHILRHAAGLPAPAAPSAPASPTSPASG